jgi:hypothetical protein
MLPLLLLIALLPFGDARAEQQAPAVTENKTELNPTKDPKSKTGVYIPKDLQDALRELDHMLPAEAKDKMKISYEQEGFGYHFGLGMWLRNNWGLWHGSRLAKHFNKLGVKHPDDISGIILDCYWRYLNGKPLDTEQLISKSRKAEREIEKQFQK